MWRASLHAPLSVLDKRTAGQRPPAGRTRLTRSKLRRVIDHSAAGFLGLSADGRIVVWNRALAELVGVPAEHALGRRIEELFTLTCEDGSAVRLAAGFCGNLELTTTAGRSLWVEVSFAAPAHPSGMSSAVFVDRTMERQLEGMRRLLLNSVHHELCGPLTAIHGHAQLLDAVVPVEEDKAGSLPAIHDAVETMERVIDDLHLIIHGSAQPTVTFEPIDVAQLIRHALRAFPPVAARAVVDTSPGLTVYGDPIRLRQCLMAVLSNADKYAPEGRIHLTSRVRHGRGVIIVADAGPGMPAREHALALRPYYRSDTARDMPGSGIGLFIAETLMGAMHGSIELDTASSGGLEVRLSLPLRPVRDGAADVRASIGRGGPGSAAGEGGQRRAKGR